MFEGTEHLDRTLIDRPLAVAIAAAGGLGDREGNGHEHAETPTRSSRQSEDVSGRCTMRNRWSSPELIEGSLPGGGIDVRLWTRQFVRVPQLCAISGAERRVTSPSLRRIAVSTPTRDHCGQPIVLKTLDAQGSKPQGPDIIGHRFQRLLNRPPDDFVLSSRNREERTVPHPLMS